MPTIQEICRTPEGLDPLREEVVTLEQLRLYTRITAGLADAGRGEFTITIPPKQEVDWYGIKVKPNEVRILKTGDTDWREFDNTVIAVKNFIHRWQELVPDADKKQLEDFALRNCVEQPNRARETQPV